METAYIITLNMKVPDGLIEFGMFFIGNNKEAEMDSFSRLFGEHSKSENDLLRLDLIEKHQGIDLLLDQVSCTLPQLEQNYRLITVDAFKYFNLEGN